MRHRRAAARAAIIQQQDAELLERALEPAGGCVRPRPAEAGPALEEDEPGLTCVLLARRDDLAGKDGDLFPRGMRVVERDGELVIGQNEAGDAVRDGAHRMSSCLREIASVRSART